MGSHVKDKFYKYNLIGGSITAFGLLAKEHTKSIFFIGLAIQFYLYTFILKISRLTKVKSNFNSLLSQVHFFLHISATD